MCSHLLRNTDRGGKCGCYGYDDDYSDDSNRTHHQGAGHNQGVLLIQDQRVLDKWDHWVLNEQNQQVATS